MADLARTASDRGRTGRQPVDTDSRGRRRNWHRPAAAGPARTTARGPSRSSAACVKWAVADGTLTRIAGSESPPGYPDPRPEAIPFRRTAPPTGWRMASLARIRPQAWRQSAKSDQGPASRPLDLLRGPMNRSREASAKYGGPCCWPERTRLFLGQGPTQSGMEHPASR